MTKLCIETKLLIEGISAILFHLKLLMLFSYTLQQAVPPSCLKSSSVYLPSTILLNFTSLSPFHPPFQNSLYFPICLLFVNSPYILHYHMNAATKEWEQVEPSGNAGLDLCPWSGQETTASAKDIYICSTKCICWDQYSSFTVLHKI